MIEGGARISDGPARLISAHSFALVPEADLMMTRLLRRWPRLLEARLSVRWTAVRSRLDCSILEIAGTTRALGEAATQSVVSHSQSQRRTVCKTWRPSGAGPCSLHYRGHEINE